MFRRSWRWPVDASMSYGMLRDNRPFALPEQRHPHPPRLDRSQTHHGRAELSTYEVLDRTPNVTEVSHTCDVFGFGGEGDDDLFAVIAHFVC